MEIWPSPGGSVLIIHEGSGMMLESEDMSSGTAILLCNSEAAALLGVKVLRSKKAGNKNAVWVSSRGISLVTTCNGELWMVPWLDA